MTEDEGVVASPVTEPHRRCSEETKAPRRKCRRAWQDEFDVAALVLKGQPGALEWATDDYVAFRYREPSVRIVFYPHRTSAGNSHLRLRDEGSKDKRRFHELAAHLYVGAGHSCTFQMKHGSVFHDSALEHGWAAQQALGRNWI